MKILKSKVAAHDLDEGELERRLQAEVDRRLASPEMRAELERRVRAKMGDLAPIQARPAEIAEQIRALEVELAGKKAQREELQLRVVNDPRDTRADTELKAIDAAIAEIQGQIDLRRGAHAHATRLHGVQTRAAELLQISNAADAACNAADARVAVLKDRIAPAIKVIGEALHEIARLNVDCVVNAKHAAFACDKELFLQQGHTAIGPARGNLAQALVTELVNAGLGSVGIEIPGLFDGAQARVGSRLSLVGAAAVDASRLRAHLNDLIARKRAEFADIERGVLPLRQRLAKEQQEREAGERAHQEMLRRQSTKDSKTKGE